MAEPYALDGATENCDSEDNDCAGEMPEGEADSDGDGRMTCVGDCDDHDTIVNPGLGEISDNGVDEDCDDRIDASCFISKVLRPVIIDQALNACPCRHPFFRKASF